MNVIIYDSKIRFNDFKFYRESNNSSECEYAYPQNNVSIEEWEEVDIYVCPHCIKKYGLYEETEMTEERTDKIINDEKTGTFNYYDLTCGVADCLNSNTLDGILSIRKCKLEDIKL